jgi:hypothetical protein
MAAALIDRVVHDCHLVTMRGNSYRMRYHTELKHALQSTPELEPATSTRRRRGVDTCRGRQEAGSKTPSAHRQRSMAK